jgi:hypothetical protein
MPIYSQKDDNHGEVQFPFIARSIDPIPSVWPRLAIANRRCAAGLVKEKLSSSQELIEQGFSYPSMEMGSLTRNGLLLLQANLGQLMGVSSQAQSLRDSLIMGIAP